MKQIFFCLFLAVFSIGCKENTPPSAPESAPAAVTTQPAPAPATPTNTATPEPKAPAPEATPETKTAISAAASSTERIKLAKGASDTDLDIVLDARETKKYLAYVAKGFMTCVMPNADLGDKVTVKINGVIRDLAEDGPCTEHAKAGGDQTIEFINNGNKEIPFVANVSFNEHM